MRAKVCGAMRGARYLACFDLRFQKSRNPSRCQELTQVTLARGSQNPVRHAATAFLPFTAADGAAQAFVGHAKLGFVGRPE